MRGLGSPTWHPSFGERSAGLASIWLAVKEGPGGGAGGNRKREL